MIPTELPRRKSGCWAFLGWNPASVCGRLKMDTSLSKNREPKVTKSCIVRLYLILEVVKFHNETKQAVLYLPLYCIYNDKYSRYISPQCDRTWRSSVELELLTWYRYTNNKDKGSPPEEGKECHNVNTHHRKQKQQTWGEENTQNDKPYLLGVVLITKTDMQNKSYNATLVSIL